MNLMPLVKGGLTFVPGVMALRGSGSTGGSTTAAYCYDVWLKHISFLVDAGLPDVPDTVAELGPGDSLGTGIAALLSGASKVVALDIVRFANVRRNLAILDELVQMFSARSSRFITGWPDYDYLLGPTLFPHHVLTEARLRESLAPSRIEAIRRSIQSQQGMIEYRVPWSEPSVIEPSSIDLIISHSVMEHVADIDAAYAACHHWLVPGGWMSHQIDFSDHGITRAWNGHLEYSDTFWRIVTGRRAFLLNRRMLSDHLGSIKRHRFTVVRELALLRDDGLDASRVWREFSRREDRDLQCTQAFIQAKKD